MRKGMWRWLPVSLTVMGLGFLITGCGGSGRRGVENAPVSHHIMGFFNLKNAYATAHKGKQPANTEEVKTWAKKLSPQELSKMNIDNVDDVLVSPRDKEEYQIAPPPKGRQFGPPPVAVYEKKGQSGTRIIVGGMGEVQEVDENVFNQLMGRK